MSIVVQIMIIKLIQLAYKRKCQSVGRTSLVTSVSQLGGEECPHRVNYVIRRAVDSK